MNNNGAEYIRVPVDELKALEESRMRLYEYLENELTDDQLRNELPHITKQIWRVANTKRWNIL